MRARQIHQSRAIVVSGLFGMLSFAVIAFVVLQFVVHKTLLQQVRESQAREVLLAAQRVETVLENHLRTNYLIADSQPVETFTERGWRRMSDSEIFHLAQDLIAEYSRATSLPESRNTYSVVFAANGMAFPSWEHSNFPFDRLRERLAELRLTESSTPSLRWIGPHSLREMLGVRERGAALFLVRTIPDEDGPGGLAVSALPIRLLTAAMESGIAVEGYTRRLEYHAEPVLRVGTSAEAAGTAVQVQKPLELPGWTLVDQVSNEEIARRAAGLRPTTIWGVLPLLLVIASFVLLLLRRSARRLRRIEDVADAVMAGDPTARVRDAAGPAGDSIGQALDQTLDAMASLVEQHKEDLQERQERELRALSNQIKPHFLFNALDTIQVMARLGGDSEVEDAASVLSRILERSVGGREGPFTLADELANVRDFVRFQEYRHQTSIDLFIDYPEELGRVRVPAFFLQPIIENSIKHGFRNSGGSGVIDVEVRCEVGDLIVTVSDSGDGAQLSAVDDDDTGHGLANVRRRLKLLYGARTSMQIDSAVGQGTSVRMVLPGQCRGALGLDHRQEASDSLQKPSEASADAPEASEIHQDCTSRRYM